MSIFRAAEFLNIFYPTAKAINKVYMREQRITKKSHRTHIYKSIPKLSRSSKQLGLEIASTPTSSTEF